MKNTNLAVRPAIILSLLTGLTLVTGLLPVDAPAEDSSRTLATGSHIPLSPDAPDEYVVKPGDTLWDISKVFLRDPWYWPEIWYVNPQVENPHLIYPGDVLKLVYVEGKPRITLARSESGSTRHLSPQVHRNQLSEAITAIPYDVIASFMGRPTLLDKDQVRGAPYVVAMRDDHIIGAVGNELYVRGIADSSADSRYSIIHIEEKLYDPETHDLLGYSGMYVGSAAVEDPGKPSKVVLTSSVREALQGDKLFPETVDVKLDFVPHAPPSEIDGSIIAVSSHTIMGQYQIVALNRGSKAGLEAGHVLAIYKDGKIVRDNYARGGLGARDSRSRFGRKIQLPGERAGLAMVFHAFDDMSYALVMEASHEIRQGDRARSPGLETMVSN